MAVVSQLAHLSVSSCPKFDCLTLAPRTVFFVDGFSRNKIQKQSKTKSNLEKGPSIEPAPFRWRPAPSGSSDTRSCSLGPSSGFVSRADSLASAPEKSGGGGGGNYPFFSRNTHLVLSQGEFGFAYEFFYFIFCAATPSGPAGHRSLIPYGGLLTNSFRGFGSLFPGSCLLKFGGNQRGLPRDPDESDTFFFKSEKLESFS